MDAVNGKTMYDLHQATVEKINYLKDHGFNVVKYGSATLNENLMKR